MSEQSISFLLHAGAKVGKTTLGSTAPLPLLVLDAEGGWKFLGTRGFKGEPVRKKFWNPLLDPPPRYDGTWDICIVTVIDWNTLAKTYEWLLIAESDFRSIILDSITEMQRRLKANLRGSEQMRIQDWGDLLTKMDGLIRGFRDLTTTHKFDVIVFISETDLVKGKWSPAMQGQIARAMPYWMDLVGYLYVEQLVDSNGQPTIKVRRLLVGSHPDYVTGERVQGVLGDVVDEPNVERMYTTIFGDVGIQASLEEAK